jgi:double-stranded uracil-DNA glycosylase
MDVHGDLRSRKLGGVRARLRLAPGLRVGQEDLHAVCAPRGGRCERISGRNVGTDQHGAEHTAGPQGIDDLIGPGCRLLLVGINPGLRSAAHNRHFAGVSNRFWPALHAAGLTPRRLRADEQDELLPLGIGITNLAARPSATAAEVSREELQTGARRLAEVVRDVAPRVVAILGISAYRVAFRQPRAQMGRQAEPLAGAELWLLPNPSGLNASTKPAQHAEWLRAVGIRAGLALYDRQ